MAHHDSDSHTAPIFGERADPRLTPRTFRRDDPQDKPKEGKEFAIIVTPEEFPELYATFETLKARIGIHHYYPLSIVDHPYETAKSDRLNVEIGLDAINGGLSLREARGIIGHELGHRFLRRHPDGDGMSIPENKYHFNQDRTEEVQADIIGACLTGDPRAMIHALRSTTSDEESNEMPPPRKGQHTDHPPSSVRQEILGKMTPANCPRRLRDWGNKVAQRD